MARIIKSRGTSSDDQIEISLDEGYDLVVKIPLWDEDADYVVNDPSKAQELAVRYLTAKVSENEAQQRLENQRRQR